MRAARLVSTTRLATSSRPLDDDGGRTKPSGGATNDCTCLVNAPSTDERNHLGIRMIVCVYVSAALHSFRSCSGARSRAAWLSPGSFLAMKSPTTSPHSSSNGGN